jgi:2-polyprenyl-6-methoxyphenol hydroxylase-like FAD-dependent oxidoreductase
VVYGRDAALCRHGRAADRADPADAGLAATPVTLLGDAIPQAPGFGANLTMQAAHCLCAALAGTDRGRLDLLDAMGAYEETMRCDRFTSVAAKASA